MEMGLRTLWYGARYIWISSPIRRVGGPRNKTTGD